VGVIHVHLAGQRLAIGHLRRTHVGFDLEFAAHAIHQDFQVKFAHPLDDGLAAFIVRRHAEGRIFLRQAVEGDAHLFLVGLRLGFHGHFTVTKYARLCGPIPHVTVDGC